MTMPWSFRPHVDDVSVPNSTSSGLSSDAQLPVSVGWGVVPAFGVSIPGAGQ